MATIDLTLVATTIVETLRRRGPLPVDYLASLVGRLPSEIAPELRRLREDGIIGVETDRAGEEIAHLKKSFLSGKSR